MTDLSEISQLRPPERAALEEYLERLQARFADRVQQVILFGSRARGEGDAESDLDVLVVVDEGDWRFFDEVALESCAPSLHTGATISPVVWDRAYYEQQKVWGLLFYRSLKEDGISLWTKPQKSPQSSSDLREPETTSKQPV